MYSKKEMQANEFKMRIAQTKLGYVALYGPLLIFVAAVCEVYFSIKLLSNEVRYIEFFANVVFLNWIHIAFTLVLVLQVEAYKNIIRSFLWYRSAYVGILVIIFLLLLGEVFVSFYPNEFVGKIYLFLIYAWTQLHFLFQIKGIFFLLFNDNEPRLSVSRRSNFNFYFWYLVCALSIFWITTKVLVPDLTESTAVNLHTFLFLPAICFLMYFLIHLKDYVARVYLLRIVLFPMAFYSKIAFFGIAAIHGIEYLLVFLHLLRRNEASREQSRSFYVGIFVTVFLFAFLAMLNNRGGLLSLISIEFLTEARWYQIYLIIYATTGPIHYLIDGIIFRFRNPEVKKLTGHFFTSSN